MKHFIMVVLVLICSMFAVTQADAMCITHTDTEFIFYTKQEQVEQDKDIDVETEKTDSVYRETSIQIETEAYTEEKEQYGSFYIEDVPMSYELQEYVYNKCRQYGVPYPIALGVIETESGFGKYVGHGTCVGYMGVSKDYISWYNSEIGVTDVNNVYDNLHTGIWLLSYMRSRHNSWTEALICYNCGEGGAQSLFNKGYTSTGYSRTVMSRADSWSAYIE